MVATVDSTTFFDQVINEAGIEARGYQRKIVSGSIDWFGKGVKTLLINSPTGSGKTVMGMSAARILQDIHEIGVGWCAMRRNLLSQAAETAKVFGADFEYISMFDSNPPTHDKQGRPIELLVVDEAQHDAAASMAHLHNVIKPRFVLGLSATPYRTDRVKLCFEKVVRDIGIHQLVQQGYLSRYHLYIIPEWTPQCVVETYLRDPQRWGKSAFYWQNTDDAVECVRLLEQAGVRVGLVLGTHSERQREETLAAFDRGDLDALVNLYVLTEGWDCPSLKTAWVRDSVKGPTVQMAGRAFRKHPDFPFKNIVQSHHTKHPMVKTATPDESFVWMEDSWRSVKPSEKVEKTSTSALHVLAHTETTMPAYLLNKKKKNRRRGGDMRF